MTDFLTFNPGCENILCVYDEKPSSLFYERLNNNKAEVPLHLYVSPMMMTEKALEKIGERCNFSIDGYLPWQPGMDTAQNQNFINTCTRPATIFSLLGWETAMIIDEIEKHGKNDLQEGELIIEHLKRSAITGPRGEMKLDAETLYYTAPAGRFRLEPGSTVSPIEWKNDLEKEWKAFSAIQTEGMVTGWTNTYLCY